MTKEKCPVQILKGVLSDRIAANPRYSLRAFARDLQISSQQLSNLLNQKKGLSPSAADRIADRLGFTPKEKEYFRTLIESKFARSQLVKKVADARLATLQESMQSSTSLSADAFRVISDWHHFALIELLKTPTSRVDIQQLSRRLGMPRIEVREALQRLLRLGLISKTEKAWKVEQSTVLTTDGVPSEALRKFHKQVLDKAAAAINTQSINERYLSTSFLKVRAKDFEKASKLIQNFRMEFTERMATEPGEEVYALGIQYFRLTERPEEAKT